MISQNFENFVKSKILIFTYFVQYSFILLNRFKSELLEIVQILSGDDGGGVTLSMLTIYDRPATLGLDLLKLFSLLSLILFWGLLTTYGKRMGPDGLDGSHLIQKYKNNATSIP